jgi:O-antigen/teichoic acid export membrane protein
VGGFLLLMILSRRLSPTDIGLFYFSASFAESAIMLANLSLNPVLTREVAASPSQISARLAPLFGLRLVSGPVYLVSVTVAAMLAAPARWPVVAAAALFTLLEDLYFSLGALFLAMKKAIYNVSIGVIVQSLFLVVFVCGMYWGPSLEMLLGVSLLRSVCMLGAALYVTQRWLCPLRVSWDSRLVRAGIPFILLTILGTIRRQGDTLMLGFLAGYEAVGHYNLANRVLVAALFLPGVVNSVLFPEFAAQGLSARNRRLFVRGVGYLAGAGALAMVLLLVGAAPLAKALYGPLGSAVAPLIRLVAILFPLSFVTPLLSSVLQGMYQERRLVRAAVLVVGTSVLLNAALIPRWGAEGAIYAQIATTLIQLGIQIRFLAPLWKRATLQIA